MTHVMDIGTDLDDLLGRLADDLAAYDATSAVDDAVGSATADDRGPLVRPMPGLTTNVWYA
jgi:hypothetical protein